MVAVVTNPLPGMVCTKGGNVMVAVKQKEKKKSSPSKPKARKKSSASSPKNADRVKTIAALVTMVKDVINIIIAIKSFLP